MAFDKKASRPEGRFMESNAAACYLKQLVRGNRGKGSSVGRIVSGSLYNEQMDYVSTFSAAMKIGRHQLDEQLRKGKNNPDQEQKESLNSVVYRTRP
jgi:hypothetical protein